MRVFIAILGLLAMAAGVRADAVKSRLLVLPFEVVNADAKQDWIGSAIADRMESALEGTSIEIVIRGKENDRALVPQRGQRRESAARIGHEMGAEFVVYGTGEVREGRLEANAYIVRVASERGVGAAFASGAVRDLFDISDNLAGQVRQTLLDVRYADNHPEKPIRYEEFSRTYDPGYTESSTTTTTYPDTYSYPVYTYPSYGYASAGYGWGYGGFCSTPYWYSSIYAYDPWYSYYSPYYCPSYFGAGFYFGGYYGYYGHDHHDHHDGHDDGHHGWHGDGGHNGGHDGGHSGGHNDGHNNGHYNYDRDHDDRGPRFRDGQGQPGHSNNSQVAAANRPSGRTIANSTERRGGFTQFTPDDRSTDSSRGSRDVGSNGRADGRPSRESFARADVANDRSFDRTAPRASDRSDAGRRDDLNDDRPASRERPTRVDRDDDRPVRTDRGGDDRPAQIDRSGRDAAPAREPSRVRDSGPSRDVSPARDSGSARQAPVANRPAASPPSRSSPSPARSAPSRGGGGGGGGGGARGSGRGR